MGGAHRARELVALLRGGAEVTRAGAAQYIGTLVNEYIARGGRALAVRAGTEYVDVGTLRGYRGAVTLLGAQSPSAAAAPLPEKGRT